jgi:ribosomal protein L30/L7E
MKKQILRSLNDIVFVLETKNYDDALHRVKELIRNIEKW